MPPETYGLLAVCLLAGFATGVAGFAFNLVAAGFFYRWMSPQEAAPLLVVASLFVQTFTVGAVRHAIRWTRLRPYVIGGALGTPIGVTVLIHADARLLVAAVGAILIGYSSYMLSRIAMRRAPPVIEAGPLADGGIGFGAGVLNGVGGFSGPLPVLWTDLKGLRKDEARAVFQPFVLVMQALAAIALAVTGFFDRETGLRLLVALPAIALGTWLGVRAYKMIPAEPFRVILLGLLFLSGLTLLF
jgi:hypothetical protein